MKKNPFIIILLLQLTIIVSAKDLRTNFRNALIFSYSKENSIYENDDIKLEIYGEELWAINKTNKTIFIDLSQCFLVHNGSSRPMFTKDQDEKKASKKGISSSIDEFITIAPTTGANQNETFICYIADDIYGEYSTTESPSHNFSIYDKRFYETIGSMVEESKNADPRGKLYVGSVSRHFTEDNSINNIGASIAYSFNKRSNNWENISLSTWVSDVVFAPYYVAFPKNLKKGDKKGFDIKETQPATIHIKANNPIDYIESKSPLIVLDWEGNVKSGKFSIMPTTVFYYTNGFGQVTYIWKATNTNSKKIQELKQSAIFDGEDADWGKMNFAPSIILTKQTK